MSEKNPIGTGSTPPIPPITSHWPEPQPLHGALPPVLAFRLDILPDSLQEFAVDLAERMQVPLDFVAVVPVTCLAGAVSRRAIIQPKANDTGWVVVPNLWGCIVAPPGWLKSPIIQAVCRPLNQIQEDWRREHEDAQGDYRRAVEEFALKHSAWKERFKAAAKGKGAAPSRPEGNPIEPKLRRLIVNDSTFEALHEIMADNPAGILVIRDELTGWLSQLDKPGREGERAFFLSGWNGDSSHTIDRIGRGTIHAPYCCISMLGGIQPARLRSYLVDTIEDGPGNDGLMQRFQLLVWPDTAHDWNYVDRAPNSELEAQVAQIFAALTILDPANPVRFRFEEKAQELFVAWLGGIEARVRASDLHPALISHVAKYRSLMPSLALLFELADRASSGGFEGASLADIENFVSLDNTQRAVEMCSYLESHAHRIYSCLITPQLRAAQDLAEKIKQRKVDIDECGFFASREVYQKGWSGLDTPERVTQAAEVLEDAGWIRSQSGVVGPKGGRPSVKYQVNPRIWG